MASPLLHEPTHRLPFVEAGHQRGVQVVSDEASELSDLDHLGAHSLDAGCCGLYQPPIGAVTNCEESALLFGLGLGAGMERIGGAFGVVLVTDAGGCPAWSARDG